METTTTDRAMEKGSRARSRHKNKEIFSFGKRQATRPEEDKRNLRLRVKKITKQGKLPATGERKGKNELDGRRDGEKGLSKKRPESEEKGGKRGQSITTIPNSGKRQKERERPKQTGNIVNEALEDRSLKEIRRDRPMA